MGQPSDAKTAFTNQEDAKKGWVEVRDATDPSFGEVVIQVSNVELVTARNKCPINGQFASAETLNNST